MWKPVCELAEIPVNGSACIKVGELQIALFRFEAVDEVLAIENRCPHREVMVLSRGIAGCEGDQLKVSCPMHRHCFDLRTGEHLGGDSNWRLQTFPTRIERGQVYLLGKGDSE